MSWLLIQLRYRYTMQYAPQNERLNLNFVKSINVVGGKMARKDRKMDICESQIFLQNCKKGNKKKCVLCRSC